MKNLFLMIIILIISGGSNAKDSLVPLEIFAKHPKFRSMQISPKGEYLAFSYEEGTEVKLAIMDRKTSKIIAGFADGENRHVVNFDWLNDDRISITTQTIIGWLDGVDPETTWIAANADGSKRKSLMKQRSSLRVISKLENDPKHVLVIKSHWADDNVKLHKLNIYNGKLSYIDDVPESAKFTKPGIVGIGVDLNDHPRFAYEYDQGKEEYDDKDDNLYLHYKDKKDVWQRLSLNAKRVRPNINLLGVSGDNNKFYFTSNHDMTESDTLGLFEFDFNTGGMKLLFRHDDVDISTTITGYHQQVLGVRYEAGYPEEFYIDNDFNAEEIAFRKSMSASFKGQTAFVTSSTNDRSTSVIYVHSDRNPGEFYLFDKKKNALSMQGKFMPEVDPKQMAKVEPFAIQARDGLKMYGQLTIPNNVDMKNLPMVVYPHGGPYRANDRWGWDARSQMFASRGYLVLQLNFRGSGDYGDDFYEAGEGEYGLKMIDDITDATRWAIKSGYADPNRVCIHGVSYGGYATGMSVVKEPDLYKCGIPDAGFYDIKLQWLNADSFGSNNDARKSFFSRMMGDDYENTYSQHSSVSMIDKLKASLLIVHGTEDVRVPFINAKDLEENLIKHNKTFETLYKEEGHGFTKEKNRVELYEKMLEFLEKHIGK